MTSESGTEFIATPKEPTGYYPKHRKRDYACGEDDDKNNSENSDNTSSNYTGTNNSGSDSNITDSSRITCNCNSSPSATEVANKWQKVAQKKSTPKPSN